MLIFNVEVKFILRSLQLESINRQFWYLQRTYLVQIWWLYLPRCHVLNVHPRKLTPPSICNNQLYYKVTRLVIVLSPIISQQLVCIAKRLPILE